MRVRVRCHGEVALADVLADPRPRHAAQVQEGDSSVTEVVRRECRDTSGGAGACDGGAQPVGRDSQEDKRRADAVVTGKKVDNGGPRPCARCFAEPRPEPWPLCYASPATEPVVQAWCNYSRDDRLMIRLLALLLVLATAAAAAASNSVPDETAVNTTIFAESSLRAAAEPRPLRGMPLTGATGLRLLVANNPPFLLDVDTGRLTHIRGLNVRGQPTLSVLAVGKDAIVWLDRRVSGRKVARAEIYVVRHGATSATRLATAWEVAPAADGAAVWLKSYKDARHCTLREVALDGRQRQSSRPVPCSTRLVDAGSGALLMQGSSVVDLRTGRILPPTRRVWAIAGQFVLTVAGSHGPLTLTDLRSEERWPLRYPSEISGQGGIDEAAVQREGTLVALSFSDPAYYFSGTQVTDVWLLDPASRRLQHLPDMPAAVSLKFTSMSWTSDGRLVMLAETDQRNVVAVWRPGQKRISVRPVRIPARNSGSDAFVVW